MIKCFTFIATYYYCYNYYSLFFFLIQHKLMVFHWSLSDSKSPQVSRTLLSILADLNNSVLLMVMARPLISNSSSPLTKPLGTVTSAPITIGITATFMFHRFYRPLVRSKSLSLFSFSLIFTRWSSGVIKFPIRQVLFFVNYYCVWYLFPP